MLMMRFLFPFSMHVMALITNLLLLFFSLLPFTQSSCDDHTILSLAFSSVNNFQPTNCSNNSIHQLILPSRNLTGTVSWKILGTISTLRTIDLSNNFLDGSVPTGFWSSQSLVEVNLANNRLGGTLRFGPCKLKSLNLSGNRFTNAVGLSGLSGLKSLDLSRNGFVLVPPGLDRLHSLSYLDVSSNSMEGVFPRDFPTGLRFLNISINKLTGKVNSLDLRKFGRSAFIEAGNLTSPSISVAANDTYNSTHHKHHSGRRVHRLLVPAIVAISVIIALAIFGVFLFVIIKKRRRRRNRGWKEEEKGGKAGDEVPEWVVEARWTAPVVMFEKPLMELRFSDLAAATSGFGRESQLAEEGGRSGPAYRGVLQPVDMQVVVRVAEGMRGVDEGVATEIFREMSRLRHPNLLPLLGYCIAGTVDILAPN